MTVLDDAGAVLSIPGLGIMTPVDMGGGTEAAGERLEAAEDDEAALGARKVPKGSGRGAKALRLSVPEGLVVEAILRLLEAA